MFKHAALTLLMISLPALAAAQNTPPDLIGATYLCDGGAELALVHVNPPEGGGYVVALIEGRLIGMRQAVSASGARYRSGAGEESFEFWAKGNQATVSVGPEDASRTLYANCVASE